jgi:hypothetical protein
MTNVDIPARLTARPLDHRRQLPVPFVSEHADGSVDFTTVNGSQVLRCARERLCSLCGQPHDYWLAFLGGLGGFHQRAYTDPPGHIGCMRAALTLCPYLAMQRHRRRGVSEITATPGFTDLEKAGPVILAITRGYTTSLLGTPGGVPALLFRPTLWKTATRYFYRNGRLVEAGPEPLR